MHHVGTTKILACTPFDHARARIDPHATPEPPPRTPVQTPLVALTCAPPAPIMPGTEDRHSRLLPGPPRSAHQGLRGAVPGRPSDLARQRPASRRLRRDRSPDHLD